MGYQAIGITFIHTGHLYSSFRAALGTYMRYIIYIHQATQHKITSFLTIGSHAHTAITLVRDWITPLELESSSKQIRIHTHKATIIPHLSWVSLWLGFHTLAVYSHNDTC